MKIWSQKPRSLFPEEDLVSILWVSCVMTGMFDKNWKGRARVPKHWEFFKWKIFANFDHWLKCMTCLCVISLRWCRKIAVHKCCTFRLKQKNLWSPTPDACCPLLALRSTQLMTGEPRPRYSALQLLGESGACAYILPSVTSSHWYLIQETYSMIFSWHYARNL